MKYAQKILAPVDLTKDSQTGLRFAVALAAANAADLLVLHVANEYQAWQMLDETGFASDRIYRWEVDRIVRESLLDLNRFLELSVREFFRMPKLRRKVVLGDATARILDVSRDEQSDLIVLSPRRHSAVRRFFCGSVADKVTRLAPCPVLSVASNRPEHPPHGKAAPVIGRLLQGLEFS